MKQAIFGLMAICYLVSGAAAHAMVDFNNADLRDAELVAREPMATARLDHFLIAPEHTQLANTEGGNVTVDLAKKEISIILFQAFHCPEGMICAQVMPAPFMLTLPKMVRTQDRCGTVTYTATRDMRPVDGNKVELEVRDNTGNRCPHFVALEATEVRYTTQASGMGGGSTAPITSVMYGDRLLMNN